MHDKIRAPWTEQQIAALNAYQRSGRMHPFTCGGKHELHQTLIAEQDGWHCPDDTCDYRQDWAHAFMADPTVLDPPRLPGAAEQVAILQTLGQPGLAAAFRKSQQQLRDTEDQLAAERAKTAALREQLRMLEATRQLAGRPLVPEQTAGECDATWLPAKPSNGEPSWVTAARDDRTITDIPTGGLL